MHCAQSHVTVSWMGVAASRTVSPNLPGRTLKLCTASSHLDRSLAVTVSMATAEPPGGTPCTLAKPCTGSHCRGHASAGSGAWRANMTKLTREPDGPPMFRTVTVSDTLAPAARLAAEMVAGCAPPSRLALQFCKPRETASECSRQVSRNTVRSPPPNPPSS